MPGPTPKLPVVPFQSADPAGPALIATYLSSRTEVGNPVFAPGKTPLQRVGLYLRAEDCQGGSLILPPSRI